MKLCVPTEGRSRLSLVVDETLELFRLMSDYEVNLVNDSMQEFFVRFYGPKESTLTLVLPSAFLQPLPSSGSDHRGGCADQIRWSCVHSVL